MKVLSLSVFLLVGANGLALATDLNSQALDKIATNYKACIKEELIASTNEDGSLDEVFFLEGKAHCDKIRGLQIDTARANQRISASKERIAEMTDDLIKGAKLELGLQ